MLFWDKYSGEPPFDLKHHKPKSLVSISDMANAIEHGHNIELFLRDLRLKIAINESLLTIDSFRINAQLLNIASLEKNEP